MCDLPSQACSSASSAKCTELQVLDGWFEENENIFLI